MPVTSSIHSSLICKSPYSPKTHIDTIEVSRHVSLLRGIIYIYTRVQCGCGSILEQLVKSSLLPLLVTYPRTHSFFLSISLLGNSEENPGCIVTNVM